MQKTTKKATKSKSWLITDDRGTVLRIRYDGKWFVANSPFDSELLTQGKTIEEVFENAYDAQKELVAARAELARNRLAATGSRAPRGRKATAPAKTRSPRRAKPAEVRA